MKKWFLKRNKVDTKKMADALGVCEEIACVLANRKIGTYSEALRFLNCNMSSLYSPDLLKDLKKGIQILSQKIKEKKKIAVYGDYDVDGVMSTVILYKALSYCGADVIYYVPHRQKEGYGLNLDAVIELADLGIDTLITTDNGIAAIPEIKRAKELSMTILIIDHHEPAFEEEKKERKDILPCADVIIDPKQKDCTYPFDKLCAGGLAFKFACSLLKEEKKENKQLEKEFLVLASIATVCDIVDLLDENRTIVQNGLCFFKESGNLGLNTLIKETGLQEKELNEFHIGFIIGPCINATGRLESARMAVELFTQTEEQRAFYLAQKLIELNNNRKNMTLEAVEKATEEIEISDLKQDKVFILFQKEVHESIAGIVAGRLKEKYYHPVIVFTQGEAMAKGSARSIEAYNIFEELYKCRDLFYKFGGHSMAAGLSMEYERIEDLRKRLNKSCQLTKEDFIEQIKIEKQLSIGEITFELVKQIQKLAPFGKGNPSPLFGDKHVFMKKIDFIGKNKDILRFTFLDEKTNQQFSGISFHGYENFINQTNDLYGAQKCDKILKGESFCAFMDIVYGISINTYRGKSNIQLIVEDFRYSK